MGLIIGLIGANIVAKTIGDQCVKCVEKRNEGVIEKARLERDAQITSAQIQSSSMYASTRVKYETLAEIEKIRAQKEITTTAMKTGMFSGALGGCAKNERIERKSQKKYSDNQENTARKALFCMYCGERLDSDARFCKYCGNKCY